MYTWGWTVVVEVDAGEEVSLLPAFPRPPHRLHVLLIYSPKAYKEGCEGLGEPQRGAIWRKGVFFWFNPKQKSREGCGRLCLKVIRI